MIVTMDDNINVKVFYSYERYQDWCIRQIKKGLMTANEIVKQDVFNVEEGEDIDEDVNFVTDGHNFHLSLFNIEPEKS